MIHMLAATVLALPAIPPTLSSPPTISLPQEIRGSPGRMIRLEAQTPCEHVCWAATSDEVDLIPFPTGKVAWFCSPKPGRFLVLAWTARGDQPSLAARCIVHVGEPEPVPTPPADPFAQELQTLYQTDRTPGKAQHRVQLAAAYREVRAFVKTTEARTVGEVASRLRQAVSAMLPAEALPEVRRRIAEEIARQLPAEPDHPLTDEVRQSAAILFQRIADTLETLR